MMPLPPEALARTWFPAEHRVKIQVLHSLLGRPRRFSEIQRLAEVKFPNQVTQALESLRDEGVVSRMVVAKGPQGVEYEITPRGIELWNEWYVLHRVNMMSAQLGSNPERVLTTTAPPANVGKFEIAWETTELDA